jgi:putative inorganic carbon (HCO3(-)) transporter
VTPAEQSWEHPERPPGTVERAPAVRTLGLWALAISVVPVVVLVPLAIDPFEVFAPIVTLTQLNPGRATAVKFVVLMVLSLPLLVAVVGALLAGGRRRGVPVLAPALAFLGVSALSALLSAYPAHALVGDRLDGLLPLACGVLLFYAAARFLDSWARVRLFLAANVFTAILVSLYGILQKFGLDPALILWPSLWPNVAGPTGRVFSTIGNPLFLASYLTLMAGCALALYFLAEGRGERVLWLGALALVGACWLYTYSRGAALGTAVALPVLLWVAHRRLGGVAPLLPPLGVLAAAMLAAQLCASLYADATNQAADRAGGVEAPRVEAPALLAGARDANAAAAGAALVQEENEPPVVGPAARRLSASIRLLIWRDTVPVIFERPLLGHGPGTFALPFARHWGEDLQILLRKSGTEYVDKAHNQLLQVAATTGLLGLAAYLWVFASYFLNVYRRGGWALLALSGGVLAYVLQIQTSISTIVDDVALWTILGASVAVMRLQDLRGRNRPASEPPKEP